jgi:hypothetical protein
MRQLFNANRQIQRNLSQDIPRSKIFVSETILFDILLVPVQKRVDKRAKCIFGN